MTKTGFVKFDEMRLKGRHLKEIPNDQAALLSILSCAYNEVNTLLRLYALNSYEVHTPKPAQVVSMSTKMFLARTLSAKLFETVELLRGKKSWNKSNDDLLVKFRKNALSKFEGLADGDGYNVASALRNECSNHYSLSATGKNVDRLDDDADLTLYLHKTEGNSFALAGERVVFQQRFEDGRFKKTGNATDVDYFAAWLDWSLKAIRWLKEITAELLFLVLPTHVSKRINWTQMYWPEPNLFGELGKARAPIFLQEAR